jgi:PAS domain S-box-containing protein
MRDSDWNIAMEHGVTMHVLAAEAFRVSEEQYRIFLDEVQDYAIFVLDPQGLVLTCNAGAERIKGYAPEEIVGHSFSNFFPAEDIERGRPEEVLRNAAATGRCEIQGMRVRKDGSQFLARVIYTALRDTAGKLRGFSEISRDLSETKESGAKYRGLLEAAPDAMVVVNQYREIVLLNVQAEKQFGYRRDELVGQKIETVISQGFAERLLADGLRSAAEAMAQQIGMGIELYGRRRDGTEFPIEIMLSPLDSAEGVLVTVAIRDITKRRLIERQLAQSQKMEAIGNLTGGMAHDFNNGLGVIIGNLDLLGRLVKADRTAAELCEEARAGALRCADMIRRLLAFARRQPLHPESTDVNALVGDTARLLGRTLGEDIALNLHLDAALCPALADPAQLEAALVNLATNARDAMPKGGQLDITTSNVQLDAHYAALHPEAAAGAYVLIAVSDTGIGIAPEIVGQIFEPFFTTKEPGQGTGLGLSMVFGFVKQSDGHLAVYSEPGRGSTFRIYLPRVRVGDAQTATPALQPPVVGGDETVLVVEDNAQLRRAAARQLAELGYQVREAEHAAAALAILSGGARVDLLFTDVVMPGSTDGLELAQQAMRRWPGVKVLLTSGFPAVRGRNQHMTENPFPLLNKPYRYEELAGAVREALDRREPQRPAAAAERV